jgi:hypothetical protein
MELELNPTTRTVIAVTAYEKAYVAVVVYCIKCGAESARDEDVVAAVESTCDEAIASAAFHVVWAEADIVHGQVAHAHATHANNSGAEAALAETGCA